MNQMTSFLDKKYFFFKKESISSEKLMTLLNINNLIVFYSRNDSMREIKCIHTNKIKLKSQNIFKNDLRIIARSKNNSISLNKKCLKLYYSVQLCAAIN